MKWRVAVLGALVLLTLAYRGMAVYTRYFSPELSTRANFTAEYRAGAMVVKEVDLECLWPDSRKELCDVEPHPGDRILEIYDGQGQGGTVKGLFDYGALLRPIGAEESWRMVVERPLQDGSSRRLSFVMPPAVPFEPPMDVLLTNLGFDIYLPLLAMGAALIIGLSNPNDKKAFLAALVFLGFSTSFRQEVSQFPLVWRELALLLRTVAYCYAPYLILQFFLYFPRRSPLARKVPWLSVVFLSLASAIFVVELVTQGAIYFSFATNELLLERLGSIGMTYGLGVAAFRTFAAAAFLLSLLSLALNTIHAEAQTDKRRMLIILAGTVTGLTPFCALYLSDIGRFQAPFFVTLLAIPLIGLFPISFVYAIVKYRLFGIRLILRRGLKYALVSRGFLIAEGVVIFLVLYFTVGPLLSKLRPGAGASLASVGIAVATLGLVGGTRLINGLILPRLNRHFFRGAYDTQQIITESSRAVRRLASRPDRLLVAIADKIVFALHPDQLAILLVDRSWPHLVAIEGEQELCLPAAKDSSIQRRFQLFVHRDQSSDLSSGRVCVFPRNSVPAGRLPLARFLTAGMQQEPETMEIQPVAAQGLEKQQATGSDADCLVEQELYSRYNTQLVVPLVTAGRVLGFLSLGEKLSEEPYSSEDKELLLALAEQTAIALDYALLINQVADQQSLERELQIAGEVQAQLFPQERPELPSLDYAAICRSARVVGGDYYDFIPIGDSQLCIMVADLSGKGLSAALLMASLQALVRSHVPSCADDLGKLACEINGHLCESTADARYATLFFGVYDEADRSLRYFNAGHNPPVLIRANGDIERLKQGGMALGLFEESSYQAASVRLEVDDLLVVFSDGVTEMLNEAGEEFGEERLIELIGNGSESKSAVLHQSILDALDAFRGPVAPHDDATLIVARVE